MTDVLTDVQRHNCMSRVRSKDTKPETLLRNALWHLGFRYHVNDKRLPGKPDIVLPKYRTVVFVHGCFWHGHKGCRRYTIPQTNTDFWIDKITRNQQRDQDVWRQLEAKGWSVIIVWECELMKAALQETVDHVREEILRSGDLYRSAKEERRRSSEAYRQMRQQKQEKEAVLKTELKAF